ncbi:hypothetical protein [Pyrodictium abyssi]|uniref:Uncharacterized protein n=1 Tax=Pyrodictium abyssi TaxID=54256 RepID=A0ABM8IVG5_9CREN|nr:hypothetical protein PABY_11050 [Pyrodictium abyssi]
MQKPPEKPGPAPGGETVPKIHEDIVELARRVRRPAEAHEEPSRILEQERERHS